MSEKIRFYLDENVPLAVATGLERRGINVLTTQKANMLGAADEEHFSLATDLNRAIFTQDTDFLKLHAQTQSHAGIIYAPQKTPVGHIVR